MTFKLYISPSTQEKNVGYGDFGTEEYRMNIIADELIKLLKQHGSTFTIFRNKPEMSLAEVIRDSNKSSVDLHVAIHSDAGPITAEGTSVFYHYKGSPNSKKFADLLYKHVAPVSPGKDRGSKPDNVLYSVGLAELRETKSPAGLIEVDFHTNPVGSDWIINNPKSIAKAIYNAICEYFEVKPIEVQDYKSDEKIPQWKIDGEAWLYANGVITERHNPLEEVDFGELGVVLMRFYELLGGGK